LHQCTNGGWQELLLQSFRISSDLKFVFLDVSSFDGGSSSEDDVPSVEKKKSPKVKSEILHFILTLKCCCVLLNAKAELHFASAGLENLSSVFRPQIVQ
jgi:hypothetical protein